MKYNLRVWKFVPDINYDGVVTISDVWLWFKWLFFYPGDGLIYLMITKTPKVAQFLEISYKNYGGILSGVISFFSWIIFFILLKYVISIPSIIEAKWENLKRKTSKTIATFIVLGIIGLVGLALYVFFLIPFWGLRILYILVVYAIYGIIEEFMVKS